MKTFIELAEKMKQAKGSVAFTTGYCDSGIYLYDSAGDTVHRVYCDKSFSDCTLQEIEAVLIAQITESEIVEKMIYESQTK